LTLKTATEPPGDELRPTPSAKRWTADSLLSRGLSALLLTGYSALVCGLVIVVGVLLLDSAPGAGAQIPWWLIGLACAGIALTLRPVGHWLRRRVDDLIFGQHDTPFAMLAQLNQHLEGATAPDALLPTVAATLAATLNLPYVSIETEPGDERPAATFGTPPPGAEIASIPLTYRAIPLGSLRVSARRPRDRLSAGDARLLAELARQVGITLHAARLGDALQASRTQLVLAREEERRRIRRDLHDGLGPTLASLRLQLGALRPRVQGDPDAERLIDELRDEVRVATAEIRRLVYDLRPPLLDEFGLLGALRSLDLHRDGLSCRVEAPAALPPLPAAVEVAIYRVAAEALHNVARHAEASHCAIRLAAQDERLTLTVTDDGRGLPADYLPGIGHRSMRERAAELGGNVTILPLPAGGTCVTAGFPLKRAQGETPAFAGADTPGEAGAG